MNQISFIHVLHNSTFMPHFYVSPSLNPLYSDLWLHGHAKVFLVLTFAPQFSLHLVLCDSTLRLYILSNITLMPDTLYILAIPPYAYVCGHLPSRATY
jgi:hypothetical protein